MVGRVAKLLGITALTLDFVSFRLRSRVLLRELWFDDWIDNVSDLTLGVAVAGDKYGTALFLPNNEFISCFLRILYLRIFFSQNFMFHFLEGCKVFFVTIMCRNDELSWMMSWVGCLLTDKWTWPKGGPAWHLRGWD